ncbi:hypothetical protein [Chryseobacterium aquaticum]|uniref:hypothetical protein n=1 Tax=Chryseobacterium aquaticum TaxID=452084 RepID=UPI002FC94E50
MKILKKEKLNIHRPLQNSFYIILFLFFNNFLFSQKLKDYYLTSDTVVFKDPIIVVPNYDKVGIFVVEKENYIKEKDINKLFTENKAFIFDKDNLIYEFYRYIKKVNYDDADYDYIFTTKEGNTIILKLNEKIKLFYVGFIKVKYYNTINASAHKRYPYLNDTSNFAPVLIPYFPNK